MNYYSLQTLIVLTKMIEIHIIFCSTCEFFFTESSLKIDYGTNSISNPATGGYTERFGEGEIYIYLYHQCRLGE